VLLVVRMDTSIAVLLEPPAGFEPATTGSPSDFRETLPYEAGALPAELRRLHYLIYVFILISFSLYGFITYLPIELADSRLL
jgi:hypothetical protein